jgi:hypothetical protein
LYGLILYAFRCFLRNWHKKSVHVFPDLRQTGIPVHCYHDTHRTVHRNKAESFWYDVHSKADAIWLLPVPPCFQPARLHPPVLIYFCLLCSIQKAPFPPVLRKDKRKHKKSSPFKAAFFMPSFYRYHSIIHGILGQYYFNCNSVAYRFLLCSLYNRRIW